MLAFVWGVTGCQEEGEPGSLCDWVEEEVPLDYSLGPGDPRYEIQPGKILELLTVPLQGTLTWNGGGDWANMTPNEGMTGFSSVLTYGGSTAYRRVPGAEGDLSLACRATLDFEISISMRTDDGVLDETWETIASFYLDTRNVVVDLDDEQIGLAEKLQVVPNPDPPIPFDDVSYALNLSYDVHPFSPELPTTTSGSFRMLGHFEPTQDGDIIDMGGVNRKLAEWVGFEQE